MIEICLLSKTVSTFEFIPRKLMTFSKSVKCADNVEAAKDIKMLLISMDVT